MLRSRLALARGFQLVSLQILSKATTKPVEEGLHLNIHPQLLAPCLCSCFWCYWITQHKGFSTPIPLSPYLLQVLVLGSVREQVLVLL